MIRLFFVFAVFACFVPVGACAHVVVSEIAWMGTPVDGVDSKQWWRYEWIELYNASDTDISVAGWTIELQREQIDFVIPLEGFIGAQEYFVAGASSNIKGVTINYATLAGKFVNSGQRVVLKDGMGTVVDEVDARQGWFAGDNNEKLSMERRFVERDSNNSDNWGASLKTGGTLGAANSILGREAIVNLGAQDFSAAAKESHNGLSFAGVFQSQNVVFILAALLAAAFALLILLLRYYLRSRDEDSFGVLRD